MLLLQYLLLNLLFLHEQNVFINFQLLIENIIEAHQQDVPLVDCSALRTGESCLLRIVFNLVLPENLFDFKEFTIVFLGLADGFLKDAHGP